MSAEKNAVSRDILGMTPKELGAYLESMGEKSFRAAQVYRWIYWSGVFDFPDMTDLSRKLRQDLSENLTIGVPKILERSESKDSMTVKYAFGLSDGSPIETVKIFDDESREKFTICVSTQVGCPIGCMFCQTGRMGFARDLTAGEIVGQVLAATFDGAGAAGILSNVVYMGMGEPLLNYDNVVKSLRILNEPAGLNVSMRKMTVSTAGVVPKIIKLADEDIPVTLAVSLHAPDDSTRNFLVPLNKKYPVHEVVAAARKYADLTSRRVTFEYVMIADVNDSRERAKELAKLLKGGLFHVNLIGLNVCRGELRPSPRSRVTDFRDALIASGINATIRGSRGNDINAACGMLYQKISREKGKEPRSGAKNNRRNDK